jgi:hypothetical protein
MTYPDSEPEEDVGAEVPRSGFLPVSPPRASAESVAVRLIATAGVVGIGTAIGAIMADAEVAGWVTGLVVSLVAVALAALLWRNRTL